MARAKKQQSFEELMQELEQRTARMELGQLTLDETLAEYAASLELIRQCRERLRAAGAVLAPEEAGDV